MTKILALIAAFILALPAAEGAAVGDRGHHRGQLTQRLLEKFDTDKDGKLSEAERAAAKAACIAKHDSDGDGKLSEAERDAARAAFSARLTEKHPELFARIDRDGDGTISRDEGQAARAKLRERHGKGQGRAAE